MESRKEYAYPEEAMKKINPKILSIPPYISTSWRNVDTLHTTEKEGKLVLMIALHNGTFIDIPNLEKEMIKTIFDSHSKYIEQESRHGQSAQLESLKKFDPSNGEADLSFSIGVPFQGQSQIPLFNSKFNPTSFLEHNPSQANAPKMPIEVIQKITSITKALGLDLEQMNMPKAEPHCNCPYCQLVRAIQTNGSDTTLDPGLIDEEVSPEDLKFRDWDITQQGDKLYIVSNPLDTNEQYQVYLGSPIGCTCGKKNCEHVRSVLNS